VRSLVRDHVAVSVAGRRTPTAHIAAEYAAAEHPGGAATSYFDGRRLSVTGAAWANGVLANALDFDDGHRLTKGHPGANVIPAALAVAETTEADPEELLAAIAVGYEIAIRAGIELHERSSDYHASGAWGALGAAAASASLLGLEPAGIAAALGLAEYHAPGAPIMRSVAEPAMTKDACGWGALLGTSAALLAARGFTSVGSVFAERACPDLGERWRVEEVYVKKFPCCRWAHPALEAAFRLRAEHGFAPDDVGQVEIRSFAELAGVARGLPRTTEEAQYSVVWPVAVALAHNRFGPDDVLGPGLADRAARALVPLIQVTVDPGLDRAFPARRLAVVTVTTRDGSTFTSPATEAPGEPEDPEWAAIIEAKLAAVAAEQGHPSPGLPKSPADSRLAELLALVTTREPTGAATRDA